MTEKKKEKNRILRIIMSKVKPGKKKIDKVAVA